MTYPLMPRNSKLAAALLMLSSITLYSCSFSTEFVILNASDDAIWVEYSFDPSVFGRSASDTACLLAPPYSEGPQVFPATASTDHIPLSSLERAAVYKLDPESCTMRVLLQHQQGLI